MNPRDPLHRTRPNQEQPQQQKDLPSGETSMPRVPEPAIPGYGDKPEQLPQLDGQSQKSEKLESLSQPKERQMVQNTNKPVKFEKKVKIPDEQTESPGTPMGNFQGHNVREYGKKGYKGRILEKKQTASQGSLIKKEDKPLSFNDAEPKTNNS